ncbi:DedA family protein [Propionibacteriaceae bacterium Y1685]|uniref:DedA family protein n=1 Tax=Microlunatus sp. Y1700 TaxID=3418487 RepID=UPI003B7BC55D
MRNHEPTSEDTDTAPTTRSAGERPEVDWSQIVPWEGKAQRGDKVLLGVIVGIVVLLLAALPLSPFLIAANPILLEFIRGSYAAIGAGAAFARIGEAPLWLVVVAGMVGMAKFDWLFWLCGRRWGAKVIKLFTPSPRAQALLAKLEHRPWLTRLAVIAGVLPGIPAAAVYALAGFARMRLGTFLVCNLISSGIMTGLIAWLGYSLGQHAVDVVIKIDDYALWISLALVVGIAVWSSRRSGAQRKRP